MVLGLLGLIFDVWVAVDLRQQAGDTTWWFGLTLGLVLVPLFVINLFSAFWFHQDHIKYDRHYKSRQEEESVYSCTRAAAESQQWHPRGEKFSGTERAALVAFHALGLGPILRQVYSRVNVKWIMERQVAHPKSLLCINRNG